jgi:hypothetical protein
MFEARAMVGQFQAYTKGITLCPFGGNLKDAKPKEIEEIEEEKSGEWSLDDEYPSMGEMEGKKDDGGYNFNSVGMTVEEKLKEQYRSTLSPEYEQKREEIIKGCVAAFRQDAQ